MNALTQEQSLAQVVSAARPQALWVEQLTASGKVKARQRFDRLPVSVGGDYSNDLIVDDPAVGDRHLVVCQDQHGALAAVARNGHTLPARGGPEQVTTLALDASTVVQLGRTRLRFRQAGDSPDRHVSPGWQWHGLAIAVLVFLVAAALATWGEISLVVRPRHWLRDVIDEWQAPVMALAWVAAWALLSRCTGAGWRLATHLLVTSTAWLAWAVAIYVLPFAAYSIGWTVASEWNSALLPVLIAAAAGVEWRLVNAGAGWPARISRAGHAVVALGLALSVGALGLKASEDHDALPRLGPAPPPAFSFRSRVSPDQALSVLMNLQAAADASARETPPKESR